MRTLKVVDAATLSFGILQNDFHRPFVNGKANRDRIEDAVTIGMMNKQLGYVTQDVVNLAIDMIDELIAVHGVKE